MDLTLDLALPPAGAKAVDVVAVGESSLDFVTVVEAMPAPDAKVRALSFDLYPGGQAATAAVGCARQGWRARYVGCLGTDRWADVIDEALARERVDRAVVRRAGAASRTASVLVERTTGRRTIIEHRDPNQRLTPADVAPIAATGRVLLVDASDVSAAIAAARSARQAGVPTLVDVDRLAPGIDELLALIDIVIVGEAFAIEYSGVAAVGEAVKTIGKRLRPAMVVATMGPEGSLAWRLGVEVRTPGWDVPVVDSTGAGDAFRAGFVCEWLSRGPGAGLPDILNYANAMAALNCGAVGAQSALPTRAAVERLVTAGPRHQSK